MLRKRATWGKARRFSSTEKNSVTCPWAEICSSSVGSRLPLSSFVVLSLWIAPLSEISHLRRAAGGVPRRCRRPDSCLGYGGGSLFRRAAAGGGVPRRCRRPDSCLGYGG